eukprot:GHUV01053776.1.p1 GENE.GHUV01053776.1~~GHUV01053776.1.p1  ORF type:complete len:107 (-),score=3.25 GHUV01053776.1:36-356(-)
MVVYCGHECTHPAITPELGTGYTHSCNRLRHVSKVPSTQPESHTPIIFPRCSPRAGPRYAFQRDSQLGRLYIFFAGYLVILWCCYPVVWGLAEGSNTISVTAEVRG